MSKQTVRLLAIAPSCIVNVNRAIYRYLTTHYGIEVHLVIPVPENADPAHRKCDPLDNEPFMTYVLLMRGSHPRLWRIVGLADVLEKVCPTHIIVDTDPMYRLVYDIANMTKSTNAKIWCISYENRPRAFGKETIEGLAKRNPQKAMTGLILFGLWQLNKKRVNQVFVLCQDGKAFMERLGFGDRLTKIPLGFDPALFYPHRSEEVNEIRQRLGLHNTTIAYFGRIVKEKGVDLLLQALDMVKDLSWHLLIDRFKLTATPYQEQIQQQIEQLGLTERVVYFDAAHDAMPLYMNAADIVVLPSVTTPTFKEQYGRVIPEAMACGKIVVGSRSGTIPELIDEAGYLFAEGNITELGNLLRYLLTAPAHELDIMRAKAQQRAHQSLSIVKQGEVWYELLSVT